jgi:serine/threonine protein kinase
MEGLSGPLNRFVKGISNVDELRDAFREYLRRNPGQREQVWRWLGNEIEVGRASPAVLMTVRDLLVSTGLQAATLATVPPPTVAEQMPAAIEDGGSLRIGSILDTRYTLIEQLGHGGMGTVYKARDRNRDDFQDRHPFIALKVLSEEFKRHPDARMALQRETVRAQSLAHPNIITVYDFDYDGPHAYMTMELLEGQTLDSLIASEGFSQTPFDRRWQIVRSIGAGLSYAHEKGVVHSDLKPGNVFLCKNGAVKVMDFGIARPLGAVTDGQLEVTLFDAAERIGGLTPAYAALEQWNRDSPDPRDDIYAFACVAYFIFSGKHPYARSSARVAYDARLVPQRIDSLTRRQWEGLRRGLALRRAERIESVAEFLRLLAPQTWLQKYRVWVSAAGVVALSVMLFFVARSYSEYVQDQALNAQLWPNVAPSQPLNDDQRHEIDDWLYLSGIALKQAAGAQTTDEIETLLSKGANNLHDLLTAVRQLDPGNAQALQLTADAAHAYADFARAQLSRNNQAEALRLVSDGQKFEHTRELLRLRQDICRRDAAACRAD